MVFEQSAPSAAKSAERMEGAMMAAGDILDALEPYQLWVKFGWFQCLERIETTMWRMLRALVGCFLETSMWGKAYREIAQLGNLRCIVYT
jgi:hypothetical protein